MQQVGLSSLIIYIVLKWYLLLFELIVGNHLTFSAFLLCSLLNLQVATVLFSVFVSLFYPLCRQSTQNTHHYLLKYWKGCYLRTMLITVFITMKRYASLSFVISHGELFWFRSMIAIACEFGLNMEALLCISFIKLPVMHCVFNLL